MIGLGLTILLPEPASRNLEDIIEESHAEYNIPVSVEDHQIPTISPIIQKDSRQIVG